jgi:uncharacterized phage protein gp47/JayE
MSITATGFETETLDQIFVRLSDNMKASFPDANINPDNLLYQWIKGVSMEILSLQSLVRDALENITVYGASGVFLDKFGTDALIFRKNTTYANGHVEVVGIPDGSTVPIGTTFSTQNNKNYVTTDQGVFAPIITMQRSSGLDDYIPDPYLYISGIEGIWTNSECSGAAILTGYYTYTSMNDYLTWKTSYSGYIGAGGYYYLKPSGSMGIQLHIKASDIGTTGNTATNTIIVNTDSLSNITSVANATTIYNGLLDESDEDYRNRLIGYQRKTFTLNRIKAIVDSVEGVKASKVYQNQGTDYSVISDWTKASGCSGSIFYLTGADYLSFSFYPASTISTLAGVTMYGRAMNSGNVPEVNMWVKGHSSGQFYTDSGYYLTKYTFSKANLLRDQEQTFQDLFFPLSYNNMDVTRTYMVYLQNKETGVLSGNSMAFCYTGITSTSYRLDTLWSGLSYGIANTGLIYKTHYKSPSINIDVTPHAAYDFSTEISPVISGLLDYVEGDGNMPIGVAYTLTEATKTYLSVYAKIYISNGYNFATVTSLATAGIAEYLNGLSPADDINVAQVHKKILNVAGVTKVVGLKMKLNSSAYVFSTDEKDIQVNDGEYVVLDENTAYDGVVFVQG